MVDEHAGQAGADRLVNERRGHRRIDAAGESEDHVVVADLRADPRHRLADVVLHVPVVAAAADVVDEAPEDRGALLRVRDFGVELDCIEAARRIRHRGDRARVAAADQAESRRQFGDLVAVAHPDVEQPVTLGIASVFEVAQQPRMSARPHFGVTELADAALFHRAAELRGHRLHPVADAEHRHAERPHGIGCARRVAFGDAVRSAGEDDALRRELAHEVVTDVVRMDFAVDVRFAQAACDELRVLRAEVEDENPRMRRRSHGLRRGRTRFVTQRDNLALP